MQEKKEALLNKGYLISTMKCFFTLLLYNNRLRVGEGKQYVLTEHFKWQELLLKERRRKFLGSWAFWVCLAHTTGEHLACLKNILVFQLQNPLGSIQSTVSTALALQTLQKVVHRVLQKINFSSINILFVESWNRKRMQYTDTLLSSKKDICQEPSISFVLLHFRSSHLRHTSCYDSYVPIIWREITQKPVFPHFFSISIF